MSARLIVVVVGVVLIAGSAEADMFVWANSTGHCQAFFGPAGFTVSKVPVLRFRQQVPIPAGLPVPSGVFFGVGVISHYRMTRNGEVSFCSEEIDFGWRNNPDPFSFGNFLNAPVDTTYRFLRKNLTPPLDEANRRLIRRPIDPGGIRGSLGFLLTEQSPAYVLFSSPVDTPDGNVLYFHVDAAGADDWLDLAVDGVRFFRAPMAAFEAGQWYKVEVPPLASGEPLWSFYINSAGPADSAVYFPLGTEHESVETITSLHEGTFFDVTGLALSPDDGTLFVSDAAGHAIYRLAASGGLPVRLNADVVESPRTLVVSPDGATVYVARGSAGNNPSVVALPSSGGSSMLLAPLASPVADGGLALAPDGATLYAALANGQIVAISTSVGAAALLAQRTRPRALEIDSTGTTLWFEEDGVHFSLPATGGAPVPLGSNVLWRNAAWLRRAAESDAWFVQDSALPIDENGHVVADADALPGAIFAGPAAGSSYSFVLTGGIDYQLRGGVAPSRDGRTVYFAGFRNSTGRPVILRAPVPSTMHAPVAHAGSDQVIEATGVSTPVALDGSHSTDADGPTLAYAWIDDQDVVVGATPTLTLLLGLGERTYRLRATDPTGLSSEDDVRVTVRDTTPPTLTVPAGITTTATSPAGAPVTFAVSSADIVDPAPLVVCTPASGSVFSVGQTSVACSATDATLNVSETKTFAVLVQAQPTRLAGSGYSFPETAPYRASFAVDARGPSAAGAVQYSYTRTRMSFVSTALTHVSTSGTTMTIEGTGSINGVTGYSFTATATDGVPDSFGIVIRRSDGSVLFAAAPTPLLGGGFTVSRP